jgi:hypothetical protein
MDSLVVKHIHPLKALFNFCPKTGLFLDPLGSLGEVRACVRACVRVRRGGGG